MNKTTPTIKKKSFLSALLSKLFSTSKEKKERDEKYKEVQLSALKSQQAFIEEYNKIQNKTSKLSRKQRDYVICKIEALIDQRLISKRYLKNQNLL